MTTKKLMSEEVIIDLQEYALNAQGFVVLQGLNGRGKTYAAMKIYEQRAPYKLPAHDHDVAWFISQADLHMSFMESHEKHGHAMTLLKKAQNTRFLVLDDLGTRVPSEAFKDFLYALIDKRYSERHKRGTMITTNLDSVRIRKDFGDAVFSRIASGRIYVVVGDDRRFSDLGF